MLLIYNTREKMKYGELKNKEQGEEEREEIGVQEINVKNGRFGNRNLDADE